MQTKGGGLPKESGRENGVVVIVCQGQGMPYDGLPYPPSTTTTTPTPPELQSVQSNNLDSPPTPTPSLPQPPSGARHRSQLILEGLTLFVRATHHIPTSTHRYDSVFVPSEIRGQRPLPPPLSPLPFFPFFLLLCLKGV